MEQPNFLITPEMATKAEKALREQQENLKNKEQDLQEKIKAALEKYQNNDYGALFEKTPEEIARALSEKDFFEQSVIFQGAQAGKQMSFDDFFALYNSSDDNRVKILAIKHFPEYENLTDEQREKLLAELKNTATYNFDFSQNKRAYHGSYEENEYAYRMFGGEYLNQDSAFAITAIEKLANIPGGESALLEVLKKNWEKSLKGMHYGGDDEIIETGEGKTLRSGYWEHPADQKLDKELEPEDDLYDEQYDFEDERGGIIDHETQEGWDVCFLENRYALEMLAKKGGQSSIDMVLDLLKDHREFYSAYHKEISKVLTQIGKKHAIEKIENIFLTEDLDDKGITRLVWAATDLDGAEQLRKKMNDLAQKSQLTENIQVAERVRKIRSFFTPNHTRIAIENLQKFYQKNIRFEEYKVNEKMNQKEAELLESLIDRKGKVLEMGCGIGRLIKELIKDGFDVAGYDFTERHVKITKEEIEKQRKIAKIFQGDWHNNALSGESLNAVYSLGRNILHDYSIADQAQLFREANRILKPGGQFIFDIPNREKGGYKQMVDGYVQEMEKRGIRNFRYGTIYDSPDGKNFATRYAYSHDDIKELARISGFKIVKIEKRELETGRGDENLYYVLEKI